MRVGVIGTGYVGLVTGTCFAELGNQVICVDIDKNKVAQMKSGTVPIYEPGLDNYFHRNINEGRLHFTTALSDIIESDVIFLALPTPPTKSGEADLSYILSAVKDLGKILKNYTVIVNKSTVPVGTAQLVRQHLAAATSVKVDVVSNPEFLREGSAIEDFMKPDRVVIGTTSDQARKIMKDLYFPLVRREPDRLLMTDEPSAEMIKYAANAMLAVRISFINELSQLCEAVGADIESVRRGIGSDARIGPAFLYPGPGYGGSCFPKDTLAITTIAKQHKARLRIVEATIAANERQKQVLPKKVANYYKNKLKGKTFALWGLAFKDNTDDVRESPALSIIEELTSQGARVVAFDPQAIKTMQRLVEQLGGNNLLSYVDDQYKAVNKADALIVVTNWKEFSIPDFKKLKKLMKTPVIFDGRNLYDPASMKQEGFYYESIGRKVVA